MTGPSTDQLSNQFDLQGTPASVTRSNSRVPLAKLDNEKLPAYSLDGPRDDWLFEGGTKNYKMVGKFKRRKKLFTTTSRAPSEAQTQHYAKLQQIEERLTRDGIDLEIRPSWKWERLTWAMGVSLVAPLEVRNEKELAEVARLARALILQKTSLAAEFPGFVYNKASWLHEQALLAHARDAQA